MPPGALSSNLLGMSFLGRLRQFTVRQTRWSWSNSVALPGDGASAAGLRLGGKRV